MPPPLADRAALVTGGSRGIGAAIARRLAADGAAVALTYAGSRAKAEEVAAAIASAGGRAKAIQADSADPDAVRRAVEETARAFGRLDILVNNAGVAAIAPIDEFKMEDFDRLVAVNVRAVFVAAQAAVRHMKAGGRIITIGSVNAEHISYAGGSVYAMTKAAVAGLSRGLARDLGPRGITVNTVQPGPIDTDMNPDEGAFADEMKKLTSLGRYGTADEVAALVAHLASPEAGYITGASITIDGGYTG